MYTTNCIKLCCVLLAFDEKNKPDRIGSTKQSYRKLVLYDSRAAIYYNNRRIKGMGTIMI